MPTGSGLFEALIRIMMERLEAIILAYILIGSED